MGYIKKLYIIIFTFIFFGFIGCVQNNSKYNKKISFIKQINTIEMENQKYNLHYNFKDYIPHKNFNTKEFYAKSDGYKYQFIDDDGMKVEQTLNIGFSPEEVVGYFEYRRFPFSAYRFYSEYDANGNLTLTATAFFGITSGFACYYNKSGEVIKKENLDVQFKFSIDDLIAKMKNEYDLDVVDIRICVDIERGVYKNHKNKPLYGVYLPIIPVGQRFCYVIDGDTGETLYSTTRFIFDNKFSLADEYFNSLNN